MKKLSKALVFSLICLSLVGCSENKDDTKKEDSNSNTKKEVVSVSLETLYENVENADYYKQFLGKTMEISNVYAYEIEGEFELQRKGLINYFPNITCSNISSLDLQDGSSYTITGDVTDSTISNYAYFLDNCSIK